MDEVEEYLYAMLRKDHYIKQPGLGYSIWVTQVQGHRLYGALFKRKDAHGPGYDVIARAHEAELFFDAANNRFFVLDTNNGVTAFSIPVPEPTAAGTLLALATATLVRRRHRPIES